MLTAALQGAAKGKAVATIRLPNPSSAVGRMKEIFTVIMRRELRTFGTAQVSNVWLAQAHFPDYLEANWERSRAIMQRGNLPAPTKEMVAVATSVVNNCHY